MKGLYNWLENYESSRPFEAFWDPGRELRSAIEKNLAMISGNRIDWQWLIANAEWLEERMEPKSIRCAGRRADSEDNGACRRHKDSRFNAALSSSSGFPVNVSIRLGP